MSVESIYVGLRKAGLTLEGACAMMGNMHAESTMCSNNAQDGMTNLTDEQYTIKFDSNPSSCYRDAVGYGLCQWTYFTRKQNLKAFADNWGVSVGAEDMQVAFAIHELETEYSSLFSFLCSTDDLYMATERICTEFERPAVNNIKTRFDFAQKYHLQFQNLTVQELPHPSGPNENQNDSAKPWEWIILYALQIGGYDTSSPTSAFKQYLKDIGGL